MKRLLKLLLNTAAFFAVLSVILLAVLLLSWYYRSNTAVISPDLNIETWSVIDEQRHSFNTDLLFDGDYFFLVYQSSPTHFYSSESKLVLMRSADCRSWQKMTDFRFDGFELRDPKIIRMGDSLFLYALKNAAWDPEPYQTVVSASADGVNWTDFVDLKPDGYLFWKPRTLDNINWFNTAYWFEHGKSVLISSVDGRNWRVVSDIHEGDTNDETAMEFLRDGTIIISARLEGDPAWHSGSSSASTLVARSVPDYTAWRKYKNRFTRLDGPALYRIQDKVFAVGRYEPDGPFELFGTGTIFSKKRTALFRFINDRIEIVSELPSCGDTSYPGIAEKDGYVYISYYTNDIGKDYPWIFGMFLPTEIRIAKIRSADLYTLL